MSESSELSRLGYVALGSIFGTSTCRMLGSLAVLSVGLQCSVPFALSSEAEEQLIDFAIEPDSLAEALLNFARTTGEQIIFPFDIASNYPASPLHGKMNSADALLLLLKDTPLRAYRNPDGTIIVRYDEAEAKRLRLEAGRLQGKKQRQALALSLNDLVSSLDDREKGREKSLLEELVITGSQLERQVLTTANPLSVVDSEMISMTGTVNVENAVNRYSQVIPGLTAHSNNPGNGTVTVDLRGLGPTRTLVLVNGRRYAPSDQDGIVDLNAIPTIMLEQVEIVTGGTSAVYGSDAISGVINFILKDDFEGFLADSQYKFSSRGDADKWNWDMVYGQNLGTDRGNFFFHLGYLERESLLQEERDFSKFALSDYFVDRNTINEEYGYGIPLAPDQGGIPGLIRAGSSAIPETLVFGVPGSGPYPGLSTFNADGESIPYNRLTDAYNYAPANYLQVPQKRWIGTFGANYDVLDGINIYLQSIYVHNRVDTELAPTPGYLEGVVIPVENPFLAEDGLLALRGIDWYGTGTPMQARDIMGNLLFDAGGNPVQARQAITYSYDDTGNILSSVPVWNGDGSPVAAVGVPDPANSGNLLFESDGLALIPSLARRFVETGPRRQENTRNTFNVVVGTDIDLSDRLTFSASYNYSRYTHDEFHVNDIPEQRIRNALNVIVVDGRYICADEQAHRDGCRPANIFGADNISPEAARYLSVDSSNKTEYSRQIASLHVAGEADLLSGPEVKFLIGTDWRREDSRLEADEYLINDESLGFNQVMNLEGDYEVASIFGELNFPLMMGSAGTQILEVSAAFRLSEFTTSGTAASYAAGLFWKPNEELNFRGQYQRAVRTPTISELYSDRFEQFIVAADPCAEGYNSIYEDIDGLCEATGVPAGLTGDFVQISGQIRSIYGGNENLDEEYSDTFSAGLVWVPHFLDNFQVTVDYYNIKISDMIAVFGGGTANILDQCYRSGSAENIYCQSIHRFEGGNINYVEALLANEGKASTSGIDAQLFYFEELDWGLLSENDTVDIFFQGSYLMTYKLLAAGGLREYNCAGYFGDHCGDPHPRFRFTQMTTWNSGPLSLALRWRYISGVKEGAILSGTSPQDLAVPSISAEHYFDFYLNYRIGDVITLRSGVDNMFNNKPSPVGSSQQQANTFPNFYDVLGPYMYFGIEVRF